MRGSRRRGPSSICLRRPAEPDIYAETRYPRTAGWHPLAVLADERWKLIRSSETELYDLSSIRGSSTTSPRDTPGSCKA